MEKPSVEKPVVVRKARKPKKLPSPLELELTRLAEEILIERTADARKAAALETANKLLAKVADLLGHAGLQPQVRTGYLPGPFNQQGPAHPCTWCGRPGIKRNPNGGGWECAAHAQFTAQESRTEALTSGLISSLRQASPIDDLSLPE